ncbi:hypothetical protein JZ751_008467 [Albula glossodonta]|uniref:Btz domain-containing protein n=1 Tax=Albula glossodonta TaxID=121402 RepID=A0A8T2N148_9TELE|nr:hypothetical protein JZ751_008467 [Albula glossodonta]
MSADEGPGEAALTRTLDEGKKMKGDSLDLRLDIERRKKYSSKERDHKRDASRDSADSRGSSRERSTEKYSKHHKKSKKSKKKRERSRSSSASSSSSHSHSHRGGPGDYPHDDMEPKEEGGFNKARLGPRDYGGPMERGRARGGFVSYAHLYSITQSLHPPTRYHPVTARSHQMSSNHCTHPPGNTQSQHPPTRRHPITVPLHQISSNHCTRPPDITQSQHPPTRYHPITAPTYQNDPIMAPSHRKSFSCCRDAAFSKEHINFRFHRQFRIRGRGWNRGNYPGNNSNGNPPNMGVMQMHPKNDDWGPEYTPKSRKYYLHDDREGEGDRQGRGRGSFVRGRGRFIFRKASVPGGSSPKWTHDKFQGSGEEGELRDDDSEQDHKEEDKAGGTAGSEHMRGWRLNNGVRRRTTLLYCGLLFSSSSSSSSCDHMIPR